MSECVFCGKENGWSSDILIVLKQNSKTVLGKLSVCPKCRKSHTVEGLYAKLIQESTEKFRKVVEKGEPK